MLLQQVILTQPEQQSALVWGFFLTMKVSDNKFTGLKIAKFIMIHIHPLAFCNDLPAEDFLTVKNSKVLYS